MPLLFIKELQAGVRLGLWRMDTDEHTVQSRHPSAVGQLSALHGVRLEETRCVYALLHAMTLRSDLFVGHLPSGKPVLDGYQLSISHTKGYVAVILSETQTVAVDVEYASDRVERVASRFLRSDEHPAGTAGLQVCWSAKETAYKFYSGQSLMFGQMRIRPFPSCSCGVVKLENLLQGSVLDIHYECTDEYVLTYAYGNSV
ncbi:MAG: hypothetical protein ACI350_03490 [Prevotella sp.]